MAADSTPTLLWDTMISSRFLDHKVPFNQSTNLCPFLFPSSMSLLHAHCDLSYFALPHPLHCDGPPLPETRTLHFLNHSWQLLCHSHGKSGSQSPPPNWTSKLGLWMGHWQELVGQRILQHSSLGALLPINCSVFGNKINNFFYQKILCLVFFVNYPPVNGNKVNPSENIWMREYTNKLPNCLSASEAKVIEYANCLIKRRMMSFSAISLITVKPFNGEINLFLWVEIL